MLTSAAVGGDPPGFLDFQYGRQNRLDTPVLYCICVLNSSEWPSLFRRGPIPAHQIILQQYSSLRVTLYTVLGKLLILHQQDRWREKQKGSDL